MNDSARQPPQSPMQIMHAPQAMQAIAPKEDVRLVATPKEKPPMPTRSNLSLDIDQWDKAMESAYDSRKQRKSSSKKDDDGTAMEPPKQKSSSADGGKQPSSPADGSKSAARRSQKVSSACEGTIILFRGFRSSSYIFDLRNANDE